MRVVVIEDERWTAEDLVADLKRLKPGIEVVAVLGSVREAVSWFGKGLGYDLIFSDVELGDGKCFEVFEQVEVRAPIIFCTAYDSYALKAFQTNGIGYVLKPYSEERLREALEKYAHLRGDVAAVLKVLQEAGVKGAEAGGTKGAVKRILVHHKDKIIPVRVEDIALFYLRHEVTMLLDLKGQHYALSQSLGEVEAMVGDGFFRASRQHLVGRGAVKDASPYFGRKLLLGLTVGFEEQVTVSKEKVGGFLEWLGEG